jgi:hypothetical protein
MIFDMDTHADLLERLAGRAHAEHPDLPAPVDARTIQQAEGDLGFALHPLLRAIYTQVGDGGFGPDYQLLPLAGTSGNESAVSRYMAGREEGEGTDWAWPQGVLPILTWGCAMYACVDCHSADGTVLLFEPNPGDPDEAWYVDSPTLAGWLEHYLADTGWWIAVENGDDVADMAPWPHARERA